VSEIEEALKNYKINTGGGAKKKSQTMERFHGRKNQEFLPRGTSKGTLNAEVKKVVILSIKIAGLRTKCAIRSTERGKKIRRESNGP